MIKHPLQRLPRPSSLGPKATAILQFGLLALFLALFFSWLRPDPQATDSFAESATSSRMAAFPEVSIEARSAYVYDLKEGKALYEKDPELQWPLASLTKLMTAYAASALIPDYLLIRIGPEDMLEEGDSGLRPGEVWNARKLLDYSLVISSNDGMHAIASAAGALLATTSSAEPKDLFVERMNKTAKDLGLRETYFLNQSGLDLSPQLAGGYGSAKDVAILVGHILRESPHLLEATSFHKIQIDSNQFGHSAQNTNKAILDIPNLLASKTGFTDLSGGNVVVAWNAGIDRPIIVSVLGSSYDGRFADLNALVKATLEYLAQTGASSESSK